MISPHTKRVNTILTIRQAGTGFTLPAWIRSHSLRIFSACRNHGKGCSMIGFRIRFPKWIQNIVGYKYWSTVHGFYNLLPDIDI